MSEKLAFLKKRIEALQKEIRELDCEAKEEEKQMVLKNLSISLPNKLFKVRFSDDDQDNGQLQIAQYFIKDYFVLKHGTRILYAHYIDEHNKDDFELEITSNKCLAEFMKEYRLFLTPEEVITNAIKEMRESLSEQ